jgi:hypothetical protein
VDVEMQSAGPWPSYWTTTAGAASGATWVVFGRLPDSGSGQLTARLQNATSLSSLTVVHRSPPLDSLLPCIIERAYDPEPARSPPGGHSAWRPVPLRRLP